MRRLSESTAGDETALALKTTGGHREKIVSGSHAGARNEAFQQARLRKRQLRPPDLLKILS